MSVSRMKLLPVRGFDAEDVRGVALAEPLDERARARARSPTSSAVVMSSKHPPVHEQLPFSRFGDGDREGRRGAGQAGDRSAQPARRRRRRSVSSSMLRRTRAKRSGLSCTAAGAVAQRVERRRSSSVDHDGRAPPSPSSALEARRRPRWRWVFTEFGDSPSVVGDLGDPELVVVAQHHAVALAVGQVAQRLDDLALVLPQGDLVLDRRDRVVEGEVVAERDEAAAVVVTGQVQHDRAQVGGGLRRVLDPVGGAARGG